jgi:uncharacterized protein
MSVPPPTTDAPSATPRRPSPSPAFPLWAAPAAVVLGLGLGQVGVIIVSVIGQAVGGSTLAHPSPAVSLVSDVVADAAFVAAALYFIRIGRRVTPTDLGFARAPVTKSVLAVPVAFGVYFLVTLAYAGAFSLHGKDKLPSELGIHHSTAALAGAAVFVCVIAPMAEELFFRGFLFGVLSRESGGVARRPWSAAVIVGVLFGAAHLGSASAAYLPPLAFLGFLLCIVRWQTGSLYPCMALHALNNGLALGVNELHWNAAEILGLIVASWIVIAAVTGPLARRGVSMAV